MNECGCERQSRILLADHVGLSATMPLLENQKSSREKHGLELCSFGSVVPNPVFFTRFLILNQKSNDALKNAAFGGGMAGRERVRMT